MAAWMHRLRYFFSDAWDEYRHSPGVNLLATATLTTVLFLAGLVLLVLANVERRVERTLQDVHVEVYLLDGADAIQVAALKEDLLSRPGVARVDYVSKAQALVRYSSWAADMAELSRELEVNPLPASLEVYLEGDVDAPLVARQVADHLEGAPGVEEVRFNREWLVRIESFLEVARAGSAVLAIVVLFAVAFVMASVMRLAVYARRDEIEIMTLVGATPAFVRGPFLIAGLGHGLVAALAGLGLVELLRLSLNRYSGEDSALIVDLATSSPMPFQHALLLVLSGLLVGAAGSYFAVRRSFFSS